MITQTPMSGQTLFSSAQLQYGPVGLLGRAILAAETLARSHGVTLKFVTPETFLAANLANQATWHGLLGHFDCRYKHHSADNALFILGYNREGDVVACQAAVLVDLQDRSFADHISSLNLFYDDPAAMKRAGETVTVTSEAAHKTTGRIVFSGGAWYRRDYRRIGLVEWTPRIARALARGRWDTRTTVTLMSEANVQKTVFPRNGYHHIDWAVELLNTTVGSVRSAFLWSSDDEMQADLKNFLAGLSQPAVERAIEANAKQGT